MAGWLRHLAQRSLDVAALEYEHAVRLSALREFDHNIGANSQSLDAKHGAVAASLDQIDASLTAIEADLTAMATTDGEQADAA